MKSFKKILETVYRPKGGDEQAFLDKHVVDLQAHPAATEFQFKAAKTPKAKRKADYDEKEDEKVYEAAEVHTKRADKEPVIVRSTDPKTGESKSKTVMRRAGEIKIGEEVELEESITKMSDARLKFHATKNVPHGSYTRKEVEDEHKRRMKTGGISYTSVKPSLNEDAELDEKVDNPYAVGMAAAMKATGDTPPLKKSTIVKGHEIAKSIKKEAMDPVGKADADINNDGKVDGSDKYLHARRKAIGKALRKEEAEELDEISRDLARRYIRKVADKTNTGELSTKEVMKRRPGVNLAGKKAYPGVAGEPKVRATESVEQIDELDKKTLGSYIKKANLSAMDQARKSGEYNNPDQPKHFSKAMDRMRGIKKATDKLVAKEEADLDEAMTNDHWVHIKHAGSFASPKKDTIVGYSKPSKNAPKLKDGANGALRVSVAKEKGYIIEEVEELDELKKSTLGSYVKKASGNMAGNAAVAAAQASSSMGKSSSETKRNITNRMKGIARATDKLTKEEVELDEAYKIGAMKLKDGSSVTLSREDVDALNGLSKLLNSANQSKMQDQVSSSKKEFNQILAFAKEAVQHG